jgi:5'-3' exonuclease
MFNTQQASIMVSLTLSQNNTILIDTSYYVFHRYNATLKWFSFQKENDNIDHSSLDTYAPFIDAFKKHVAKDMSKLVKRWKSGTNIIFCTDCPRSEIWRNNIYSEYKGTRVLSNTFNCGIFPIFYAMLEENNYKVLSCNNLEADDVVYLITKRLLEMPSYKMDIVIITNDNDYLQILAYNDPTGEPRIHIHNMMSKNSDISKRSKGHTDLLYKICLGDVSDNIPSIFPKLGAKTALKLANMDEAERDAYIQSKGVACQNQYAMNKTLISFDCIPDALAQSLLSNIALTFV